jgi:transcriptional regulator with XRE-family HTH domain
MVSDDNPEALNDLGRFIKAQRELSRLSLRHLARVSGVSDSYLSQIERGLYQPSPDILRSIAEALDIAPDTFFRRMGWLPAETSKSGVIDAINDDPDLSPLQRAALVQTYKAMRVTPG